MKPYRASRLRKVALRYTALVALTLAAPAIAHAQSTMHGVPNAMQGFSQNRDEPIQIEAQTLEMRDKKKEATFSGNVKVTQGDTIMEANTLVVFYDGGGNTGEKADKPKPKSMPAAQPGPEGSSSIRRIEAKGGVTVTKKDQVVTGQTAIFDTRANQVSMTGKVILTQGKNVLRGDRLVVDMTTGVSRVESNSGRVQGLFQSSGQGGTTPAPAPGQSGTPAPAGPGAPMMIGGPRR